jgi:hypothetical protein
MGDGVELVRACSSLHDEGAIATKETNVIAQRLTGFACEGNPFRSKKNASPSSWGRSAHLQ